MTRRPRRSLRSSDSFKQFVLDQLDGLNVTGRSMFGGHGLYCDGRFFGIIASDVLYFKVDDTNRRAYEDAGMKPFKPYPGRGGTMRYLRSAPVLESRARPGKMGARPGLRRRSAL